MRDGIVRQYQRVLKVISYNEEWSAELAKFKLTPEKMPIELFKRIIIKEFKCKEKTSIKHIKHMERLSLIKIENDFIINEYSRK